MPACSCGARDPQAGTVGLLLVRPYEDDGSVDGGGWTHTLWRDLCISRVLTGTMMPAGMTRIQKELGLQLPSSSYQWSIGTYDLFISKLSYFSLKQIFFFFNIAHFFSCSPSMLTSNFRLNESAVSFYIFRTVLTTNQGQVIPKNMALTRLCLWLSTPFSDSFFFF